MIHSKKSFEMTGFHFQKSIDFEPMNCLECHESLPTADAAAHHFSTAHSIDDIDEPEEHFHHVEALENLSDAEEMDEVEEMNEDEEVNEDVKIELEKWTQPNSILSQVYIEWLTEFGFIECAYCPERFQSKIAWLNHVIQIHNIHPDKMYERSVLKSDFDETDKMV